MPERRDNTSVNSPPDALEEADRSAQPSTGEDTSLDDRRGEKDGDALARDDLPREERVEHQNDLA
jgi:hypothetical protein